jgi:hypothetical protein
MNRATLGCLLATAADAAVVGVAVASAPPAAALAALLLAHLLAAGGFALGLAASLPPPYDAPRAQARVFVFGMVLFVPVLAMVGCLVSLLPALRQQRAVVVPVPWLHPRTVRLPMQAQRSQQGFAWAGSLAGTLQNGPDPNKRIAALIATLAIKEQDAIPLLRWALKDPEDEVRLLAYALLNRKEKAIEARIHQHQTALEQANAEAAFTLHKALAHDFWALSQLAIERSSTQMSLFERAREQVASALAHNLEDGGLWLLMGRILLAQRQCVAAEKALQWAQARGVDRRQIEPLRAEMAFIDGRYPDVSRHVRRGGQGSSGLRIAAAARYWEGPAHGAAAPV